MPGLPEPSSTEVAAQAGLIGGTGAPGGLATLPRLMSSWIPLSGFLDSISFFDFLFDRFVYGLRSNRYIFIDFW